jgi:transcriptional regulator with XRE-family HTH domain
MQNINLSELIKSERKRQGKTMEDVASYCGVTFQTIYNAEKNVKSIKFGTIVDICECLRIDLRAIRSQI